MKVLLLADRLNWSYHSIAQSLAKYNIDPDVHLKPMHIKGNEKEIKKKYKKFDQTLVMGWQTYDRISFLDKSTTLIGVHSHHGWDERKTTPERDVNPPRKLIKFLSKFKRVNTVSKRLYNLFRKNGLHSVYYTPNGVDTQLFDCPNRSPHDNFTIGYSGSKAHDWRKGISRFIQPAADKAKVKCEIAMLGSGSYIPLEDMPKFYRKIDCYVCASSSEGFSLSVLEAASCGCPIISTRVGGTEELIRHGGNGFLVDRSIKDIVKHIRILKKDPQLFTQMSIDMRQYVMENYGWDKRTKDWIDFLKE